MTERDFTFVTEFDVNIRYVEKCGFALPGEEAARCKAAFDLCQRRRQEAQLVSKSHQGFFGSRFHRNAADDTAQRYAWLAGKLCSHEKINRDEALELIANAEACGLQKTAGHASSHARFGIALALVACVGGIAINRAAHAQPLAQAEEPKRAAGLGVTSIVMELRV